MIDNKSYNVYKVPVFPPTPAFGTHPLNL